MHVFFFAVSSNLVTKCGETLTLSKGANKTLDIKSSILSKYGTNLIDGHLRCMIEITSLKNTLLETYIRYRAEQQVTGCSHGYLQVGNDRLRVGEETLTSYKFCDSVWDLEIVSRSNYLWIIYDYDIRYLPTLVEVNIQSVYRGKKIRKNVMEQNYSGI